MNSKKCKHLLILVAVSMVSIIGLAACEGKDDQQIDQYEATVSNDRGENTENNDNTYYDSESNLNTTSNTSSDSNQNSISVTSSSKTSEKEIKVPSDDTQTKNSGFDYTSSDGKWAVNKSYFTGEVNGQKSDCMLYTTDISDQYYGDIITEVTILYSKNITIYLDLNMSKIKVKKYSEDDFFNFDKGSVAKIMYVDNRVIDNSGWKLPAPYCYYHVVTGVMAENKITKMFDSISLKIDYVDYNKDIICAYLSFSGPNVNGDTVNLDGYFAVDLPFIASSDNNVIDNGSNNFNAASGSADNNAASGSADNNAASGSADNNASSGLVNYVPSCSVCYGTGTCQSCLGDGWYTNPFTGDKMVCPSCSNQDGKCWNCRGTGK